MDSDGRYRAQIGLLHHQMPKGIRHRLLRKPSIALKQKQPLLASCVDLPRDDSQAPERHIRFPLPANFLKVDLIGYPNLSSGSVRRKKHPQKAELKSNKDGAQRGILPRGFRKEIYHIEGSTSTKR